MLAPNTCETTPLRLLAQMGANKAKLSAGNLFVSGVLAGM
jgi:hypothetical protein